MDVYVWGNYTSTGQFVSEDIRRSPGSLFAFVTTLERCGKRLVAMNDEGVVITDYDDRISDRIRYLEDRLRELDVRMTHLPENLTRVLEQDVTPVQEAKEVSKEFYLMYDMLPEEVRKKIKIYINKS